MVTELKPPAARSHEEEPPQAQQPEAAQAEQPAGGGQPLGPAVQEHIAQAVRPILGEWEQRIVQSVRQQMEQARPEGPQGDEHQREGEEATQSSLQAVVPGTAASSTQTVQWLSNILSALLQTVRSMVQAVVSVLRAVVRVLQEALMVAVRLVMRMLVSMVQQLGALLQQALASMAQLLGEILQPKLLEALPQLVQPLLQGAAERGVAAVLKTLESTLQGRTQAQPAPTGAQEAAAR